MKEELKVFFRCDAGPAYGFGHLMRCLSLAQGFHRQGINDTTFLIRDTGAAAVVKKLLKESGMQYTLLFPEAYGLDFDPEIISHGNRDIILVFDNYDVTEKQMAEFSGSGVILIAIDDMADRFITADMIVNQNIGSDRLHYRVNGVNCLLLGPDYVLIRESILHQARNRKNIQPAVNRVFVSFGGGDTLERVRPVIDRFVDLDSNLKKDVQIDFVVPEGTPQVRSIFHEMSSLKHIRMHPVVSSFEMAPLMAAADFAVTAAGSSIFELAYLGVPMIAVIIDENQKLTGEKISECGIGRCLGDIRKTGADGFVESFIAFMENDRLRKAASDSGMRFIDGKGADRVVEKVLSQYHLCTPTEPSVGER